MAADRFVLSERSNREATLDRSEGFADQVRSTASISIQIPPIPLGGRASVHHFEFLSFFILFVSKFFGQGGTTRGEIANKKHRPCLKRAAGLKRRI